MANILWSSTMLLCRIAFLISFFFTFTAFSQENPPALSSPQPFNSMPVDKDAIEISSQRQQILREAENLFWSRYLDIFLSLLAVLATIIAGFGIAVYIGVRKTLMQVIDQIVRHRTELSVARSIGLTYNEFSFMWWSMYRRSFEKFLNGENLSPQELEVCSLSIENAMTAAGRGLEQIELVFEKIDHAEKSDKALHKTYIYLLNQYIYNTSAISIIENRQMSEAFIKEIIRDLEKLDSISVNKNALTPDFLWYEVYETISFVKFYLGRMINDPVLQSEGRRILIDLAQGRRPSRHLVVPPKEWRETILSEHGHRNRMNIQDVVI
ncbi:hypothetical protein [Jiella sonneratiae]|uniref:DUF4129 domain-containing protein n=1 Tax=Jiella sonneratiae TaxID=2816856 RepID=A0ABS3IZE4_9HYPH|nr:hypothetical protein [Jiella sonneratiae]MBO0902780.1 hypothetical protein [Jiella sonneratiae]